MCFNQFIIFLLIFFCTSVFSDTHLNRRIDIRVSRLFFLNEKNLHAPNFLCNVTCDKLMFDIGFNDGADTSFYLGLNYCVVGVDANPQLVDEGRKKFRQQINEGRLVLLNAGLGEQVGNMVFFLGEDLIHSSFNKKKVLCK